MVHWILHAKYNNLVHYVSCDRGNIRHLMRWWSTRWPQALLLQWLHTFLEEEEVKHYCTCAVYTSLKVYYQNQFCLMLCTMQWLFLGDYGTSGWYSTHHISCIVGGQGACHGLHNMHIVGDMFLLHKIFYYVMDLPTYNRGTSLHAFTAHSTGWIYTCEW